MTQCSKLHPKLFPNPVYGILQTTRSPSLALLDLSSHDVRRHLQPPPDPAIPFHTVRRHRLISTTLVVSPYARFYLILLKVLAARVSDLEKFH